MDSGTTTSNESNVTKFTSKREKELPSFRTESKFVVVEGPIGVGKTSFVRLLSDHWKVTSLHEVFEENPFLTNGFYEDTKTNGFNTETFFLLTRFRQQREVLNSQDFILADYSFEKSRIFADITLDGFDRDIFLSLYDKFQPEVRRPDLIVYLQADLETLLRRIYFRDRKFERNLSTAYLDRLLQAYYRYYSSYDAAPVLTLNTSGLDFVNERADFLKLAGAIEDRLLGQYQLPLMRSQS